MIKKIFLILILFSSCTNKTKKEKPIIIDNNETEYNLDNTSKFPYYDKGLELYDRYNITKDMELLDSSLYFFKKAIESNKKNVSSYELLISVFIIKKDFVNAEKVINEALRYTNQTAYYTAKKGSVKNMLNQKDSAQYYFNMALEKYYKKEQNLGIKNQIITILYEMGNKEESLKVLNECIIKYPMDSLYLKEYKKILFK